MSYVSGPAATEHNPPHPNQALQSKALTTDRGFIMTQQSYAMPKILHWELLLGRHSHQEFTVVKWKDRFSWLFNIQLYLLLKRANLLDLC